MGNGFLRLVRRLALFAMVISTLDFTLAVAGWAAPESGDRWIGKRMKDMVDPPSGSVGPRTALNSPDAGYIQRCLRSEIRGLYTAVRGSSEWFLLASVVYLLARRQIREETPPEAD